MPYLLLFFGCLLAACAKEHNRNIDLSGGWTFRPGDLAASNEPINDTDLRNKISTNLPWEKQGFYFLDGFGWYRNTFYLSRKQMGYSCDSLYFELGVIDDFNQTFLNGYIIGQNNHQASRWKKDSEFTDGFSLWDVPILYALSSNDKRLRWDRTNVILIRVFDREKDGGMVSGRPRIGCTHIQFKTDSFYRVNKFDNLDTALVVEARGLKKPLQGLLKYVVRRQSPEQTLYERTRIVSLIAGYNSFPVSLQRTLEPITIKLSFKSPDIDVRDSIIVPFVLNN